ncbi:MAG: hypothetical protein E7598_07505, partial [Ruminococcaceae bacterium]|nr:hypothetical protein [Oscillospiraceae bacterium]
MFIIDFWNSLDFATQVFYCIAIPSTLLLLIQTVLMFIGIGNDADGEVDMDIGNADGEIDDGVFGDDDVFDVNDAAGLDGLRIFTVRGIIAFFVVFGWTGVAMNSSGAPIFATIPVSVVSGFAMMVLVAFLLRAVMKLRSDGNTDNRNAIGTAGKVHLTIPP